MRFGFWRRAEGDLRIYGWTNDRRLFLRFFGIGARIEVGRVRGVRWFDFRIGSGDGESIGFSAGIGYCAFVFLELPWAWTRRIPGWPRGGERNYGVSWSNGRIRVMLGQEPFGTFYGHKKERFATVRRIWRNREIVIFDFDWIVGRDKVSHDVLMEPQIMSIPIGEWDGDTYTVEVSAEKMTWRNRVRSQSRKYWNFRTPDGEKAPPVPGKGENSWDIDDDGIYGLSVDFEDEPIPAYQKRIIAARRRYSSPGWRPREVANP